MKLPLYQVDAFTDRLFGGNPAAVMPLPDWLPDSTLQALAAENNLAETAFLVARDDGVHDLRWFTPTTEVQLCGHATLASAFVLFRVLGHTADSVEFDTLSGRLSVSDQGDRLWMSLPTAGAEACAAPELPAAALGMLAQAWYEGPNYMALLASEAEVAAAAPDMTLLGQVPARGLIVTAPADDPQVDFVSRFFAPNFGIPEDPVTGSAHCMLAPWWAERLGKSRLRARQISSRGGSLICEPKADRVHLGGTAVLYLQGEVFLPDAA